MGTDQQWTKKAWETNERKVTSAFLVSKQPRATRPFSLSLNLVELIFLYFVLTLVLLPLYWGKKTRLSMNIDGTWQLFKARHRSGCIKIVWRHLFALCWAPTLSPRACDTNKPSSRRGRFPRSSLPAGVSFIGSGLVWPGLSSSQEETAGLSGTEPREKTIILKAGLFQMTRIHKPNVSPTVAL